jgi:hypothetical protein
LNVLLVNPVQCIVIIPLTVGIVSATVHLFL